MRVGEQFSVRCRIVVEPLLCGGLFRHGIELGIRRYRHIVGLLEGAFAVPAVAGPFPFPERYEGTVVKENAVIGLPGLSLSQNGWFTGRVSFIAQ